ncbi:hypothetical protein [Hymenobacter lucidus]|uniref:Glycosyl-4,4'-diaponeurosporenoate acyltransferase n=1 Tax=Hymenobacter lucidus TaxID=2880930 RepID=A0ABS8ALZ7_9BACT|nr:hypothetical protein [Hymenobacter lucidus]MCB2406464.1 hypothetical protein [Hymenobacter lucidus]
MPNPPRHPAPSAALLAFCNAVPNVFWSVAGLLPVSIFCYQHVARLWLYGLLAASLLMYAVPVAWFRYWQLSSGPARYRRLGVPLINQLTQHGGLINRLLRRRYPHYRHVHSRASVRALVGTSYHQERFHLALLLFFGFISLYAATRGYTGWALLILATNVGYNLYPIWLQQYLRVRLHRHL